MSITFSTTFKTIYRWQCQQYETKNKKRVEQEKESHMEINGVSLSSNTKYIVSKWYHPNSDDLWIVSINETETFVSCKAEYIERLLDIINSNKQKGYTLMEICDILHSSGYMSDVEIALNIEAIFEHLLSLGMLSVVISPHSRYKLKKIEQIHDDEQFYQLIDEVKCLSDIPKDCSLGHLGIVLFYAYLHGAYGFLYGDLINDLNTGNKELFSDISKNANKLVSYGVKKDLLCQITT